MFATGDVEPSARVVGQAPKDFVAIGYEAWGMHRQGEDLDLPALGSGDGVAERMKATVVVAVGDQNQNALRNVTIFGRWKLLPAGTVHAIVQICGIAELFHIC